MEHYAGIDLSLELSSVWRVLPTSARSTLPTLETSDFGCDSSCESDVARISEGGRWLGRECQIRSTRALHQANEACRKKSAQSWQTLEKVGLWKSASVPQKSFFGSSPEIIRRNPQLSAAGQRVTS
jgi:hypothetical protein